MDGRKTRIIGETGADRMNLMKLKKLAASTGVPIYTLCARHGVPKDKDGLDVEKMKADDFRGMEAELLTSTGARMLLTQNLWVEAGLMNGALGVLKDSCGLKTRTLSRTKLSRGRPYVCSLNSIL